MVQPYPFPHHQPRPQAQPVVRGVSATERAITRLNPAAALKPIAIPTPESLGVGDTAPAARASLAVAVPTPESLGVGR